MFYRTKSQYKPKLEPNAQPALMAGWKLEFGLRYKGVLIVLDYEALLKARLSLCQLRIVRFTLVTMWFFMVFPLSEVAERAT